jgi:hypothetical protein
VTDERTLLLRTAELAADYVEGVQTRPVGAAKRYGEMFALLEQPLPEHGVPTEAVVEELATACEPGIVAMGSVVTSGSSSAAPCRRHWRPTGSCRPGIRTPGSQR